MQSTNSVCFKPFASSLAAALALALLASGCGEKQTDLPVAQMTPQQVEAVTAKAEAGDPVAQAQLGKWQMEGEVVPRNLASATNYLFKAAAQGNADAMNSLGMLYEAGQGVSQDFDAARSWFEKSVRLTNAVAAFNLAAMYASGRGVEQDSNKAAKFYEMAAELGDPYAQYNVAQRYELGRGVATNLVEAAKWYELASRGNVEDAKAAGERLKGSLNAQQKTELQKAVQEWLARQKPAGK